MKMKTILLFMSLFLSITVVGQTQVKYIIQQAPNRHDFVLPVGYESIIQKAGHGKKDNMEMQIGTNAYWGKTIRSFRERYFTKEQFALFKEKRYWLIANLFIDNVGNIKCVSLTVKREILETLSPKQLNNIYQTFWRLKVPIDPKWKDKNNYYSYLSLNIITSTMK